jgi:hypothetical protein
MTPEYASLFSGSVAYRLLEKRTPELERFVASLGLGPIISVECAPFVWARQKECFLNVEKQVTLAGGRMITGWIFEEFEGYSIRGVAHAIWLTPGMKRRDITPHSSQLKRVLFVEDASVLEKRGYSAPPFLITSPDERIVRIEKYCGELRRIIAEAYRGMNCEMAIDPKLAREAADRIGLPADAAKYLFDRVIQDTPKG